MIARRPAREVENLAKSRTLEGKHSSRASDLARPLQPFDAKRSLIEAKASDRATTIFGDSFVFSRGGAKALRGVVGKKEKRRRRTR